MKPRLLVLTDISSLTPRVREPDDGQSMVRLLTYSNEIEIEGLLAGSNLGHGQVCRPELIEAVVNAYGEVRDNLLLHDPDYPSAEQLLACIHAGQPVAGPHTAVTDSIGPGKDTAASDWIFQAVQRDDPRPLWVSIWGGTADLAQALWRLREKVSEAECERILANLRIHAVEDQDSTGVWIKANFPRLYYLTRGFGIRGMYRGGDTALVSAGWVETNVCKDHGALGAIYPNYDGGDIWTGKLGPVRGIKEGDTPSYLGLVNNGLNPAGRPGWGSWGGRWQVENNQALRLVDAIDHLLPATAADLRPELSATYRWRPDFQNDFAARMDWCVQTYENANHAPSVVVQTNQPAERVDGALQVTLAPGQRLELDASGCRDPHGRQLNFHWWVYPEAGTSAVSATIDGAATPLAALTTPQVNQPASLHLILTVSNTGQPPLCAYQRILVQIQP